MSEVARAASARPDASADVDLVADIYEAAALPERWPALLDRIAHAVGARGGLLLRHGHPQEEAQMVFSDGIAELIRAWIASGLSSDERLEPLRRSAHAGFLIDRDQHGPEARRSMPIYADFLTPRGADLAAGTLIRGAGGDGLLVTMEHFPDEPTARAAVPRLDALRPHLARAAVLTAELRMRRARAALEALEAIGSAAAMLDARGRLLAANPRFVDGLETWALDGRDRLRLADRAADAALAGALAPLAADRHGRSIAIRDPSGVGIAALHLLPIRGEAHDLFTGAAAIALLARPGAGAGPAAGLIQSLFDLTPAEASVARSIATGASVELIAARSGVSVETVRTHLKRVFSKTGTGRQNELAVLLMGFASPAGPP